MNTQTYDLGIQINASILGCARPVCFGYDFNGQPIANGIKTAAFHQIRNQPDGYRRLILPSALPLPFKIESQYNKIYSPQISVKFSKKFKP